MQVTIDTAKTDLSKLIAAASAGEDVIIAEGQVPVARLVAIQPSRFAIGILKDKLSGPVPDFLEPMNNDDLAFWEGTR
jgi:antitoxin (DNA-binding transcriptional repressor) of toxin-antitoxin stability system